MFEVGYSEILVIAIVLIVVVGPKDLPKMLRAFGKAMTRFRQVSGEFRKQFDDALKEADLDDVRKTISDVRKLDPRQQVREVLSPLTSASRSIKSDIEQSFKPAPLADTKPIVLPPDDEPARSEKPDKPVKKAKAVTAAPEKPKAEAKPGAAKGKPANAPKAAPAMVAKAAPAAKTVKAKPSAAKVAAAKPAAKSGTAKAAK